MVAGRAGLGYQKRQDHLVERIERVESPNSRCGVLAVSGEWKVRKKSTQKSLFYYIYCSLRGGGLSNSIGEIR